MPTKLLIATTNPGKLREVRAMLEGLSIDPASLDDYAGLTTPDETGDSFEDIACEKALHYAQLAGVWVLADDSGLEVDALGGEPGIYSSRYAGSDCNDAANNAKLIRSLTGVPAEARTARFRCVMALARPGKVVATACGAVEGVIVDEPRGANGFGYDPHFFVPQQGRTAAEMPPELKNLISHRGQALRKILPDISRWVIEPTE